MVAKNEKNNFSPSSFSPLIITKFNPCKTKGLIMLKEMLKILKTLDKKKHGSHSVVQKWSICSSNMWYIRTLFFKRNKKKSNRIQQYL